MESYGKRKKRSAGDDPRLTTNASTTMRHTSPSLSKYNQQSSLEIILGTSTPEYISSETSSEEITTRPSKYYTTTMSQNFESSTNAPKAERQQATTSSTSFNYQLTSQTTPRHHPQRPHPRIHDWWRIHLPRVPQRDSQHQPHYNMYPNDVRRNNDHQQYKNDANLPNSAHRFNQEFRADSPHRRLDRPQQHSPPYTKTVYSGVNMPQRSMNPYINIPFREGNNSHQGHSLRNGVQHHQLHSRPQYTNPNIPLHKPNQYQHLDERRHNRSYGEEIVSSSVSFQQKYPMPSSSTFLDDKRSNQQSKMTHTNQRPVQRDMDVLTMKQSQVKPPERHVQYRHSANNYHQEQRYFGSRPNQTDFGSKNLSSYKPERRQVDEFRSLKGGMRYTEFNAPELVVSTMVPVPDEVPLSLAIMVGEDTGMDISSWDTSGKNDKFSQGTTDSPDSDGTVCTTVTTIVATAVALSLAHVGGVVGVFWVYRWHRKNKRKKLMQETLSMPRARPAAATAQLTRRLTNNGRQDDGVFYAKPDVSFRNVYGSYSSSS